MEARLLLFQEQVVQDLDRVLRRGDRVPSDARVVVDLVVVAALFSAGLEMGGAGFGRGGIWARRGMGEAEVGLVPVRGIA